MILVDSNIPMYLVGGEHPNRAAAKHLVELAIAGRERLVTDVEVLQEILHRYVAIGRRDAIDAAASTLLAIVDDVYPIELEDVERARGIVLSSRLSARDAVHLAVMQRRGIAEIMTFDRAFDGIPGVGRVGALAGSLGDKVTRKPDDEAWTKLRDAASEAASETVDPDRRNG